MKRLIGNLKGRFLVASVSLGVLMLAIAVNTNMRVSGDVDMNRQLLAQADELQRSIAVIDKRLQNLRSVLFQHAVNFDLRSSDEVLLNLRDTRVEINRVMSRGGRSFPRVAAEIGKLNLVMNKLDYLVEQLLQIQMLPTSRYPGGYILLQELQPTNRSFFTTLEQLTDRLELYDSTPAVKAVRDRVKDIRYYFAQNVSTVRVFVANRSGTFGNPEEVLPKNINTQKAYQQQVDLMLKQLAKKVARLPDSAEEEKLVKSLQADSRKFAASFEKLKKSFMSKNWRVDVSLLNARVLPLLNRAFDHTRKMGEIFSTAKTRRILNTTRTSSTLSRFIWVFVASIYIVVLLLYLFFEYRVRRPVLQVAEAMNAKAKGATTDLAVHENFSEEATLLVDAYNNMDQQVNSRQRRLEAIFENAAEGIVIVDGDGIIEVFNAAAENLFGRYSEDVIGLHVRELLHGMREVETDREALELWTGAQEIPGANREIHLQRKDGREFYMSMKMSTIEADGQTLFIAIVADISEQKAMMTRLQTMADMDSLTGLHNRRYFIEEIDRTVDQVQRSRNGLTCALFYIDLDNFKYINDTHGHIVGDKVLSAIALLLKERTRKSDVLARLGGDEFAIIAYSVSEVEALEIAEIYRSKLDKFRLFEGGKELDVGCSVGIAMVTVNSKDRDEVMLQADYACHLAKREGKNRAHMFSEKDNKDKALMQNALGWVRQIKDAIRMNRFVLALQPILRTSSGDQTYSEVLLRLRDENGKLIMPFGFMPSAERFDLMVDIDRWVIMNAMQLPVLQAANRKLDTGLSINLSAQSIGDESILQLIEECLFQNGIAPNHVLFEITETTAIAHMDEAIRFLSRLREMGCRTALDDFGTGYSSFGYLKELPVDIVKIDGSFVKNIENDSLNQAMVQSMNDIAHVMGKKTIAEFVESEQALMVLKDIGVDYCQGFYLGKPQLLDEGCTDGESESAGEA